METHHIRLHGCARMVTGFCLAWMVSWAGTAAPAAGVYTWNNDQGGDFTYTPNWINPDGFPGISYPQVGDVALFDLAEVFTVKGFGTGIENLRAIIGATPAGNGIGVTYNLEEQTWTLTSTQDGAAGPAALTVGDGEGGAVNATMTVTNGTLDAGGVILGRQRVENSSGTLIISGAGATLTASHATQRTAAPGAGYSVWLGAGSSGHLSFVNGAVGTLNGLVLGSVDTGGQGPVPAAGSTRSLTVTGGSTLTVATKRTWVHGGTTKDNTTITVSDKATLNLDSGIRTDGGVTIIVDDATMNVGGGDLSLHAESLMVIQNDGKVVRTGTVLIGHSGGGGPKVEVTSGGELTVSTTIQVGRGLANYKGTLEVSGNGSSVTAGSLAIAHNASTATTGVRGWVDVMNGGAVTVTGNLTMSEVGGPTTADVQSYLEITGAQSKLTANNAYLGGTSSASGGDAYVTVTDGGNLTVTNLLRAYGTAQVTLDSEGATGTLIQAGSLELQADSLLKATLYGAQRTNAGGNALMLVTGNGVDPEDPAATIAADVVLQLTLDENYVAQLGDVFTLLQVNGTLDGTFKDRPNNAIVFSGLGVENDLDMRINYVTNNDSITLTVIPEPGVVGLLFAGALGLLARRRRTPPGA